MIDINKVNGLAKEINKHRDLYYNNNSIISDALFDKLVDELAGIDPNHPAITAIGAPSTSKEWEKYKHKTVLGSLNKVNNPEDFYKWAEEYVPNNEFFTTLKLDGLTISLVYEEGKLVVAGTRGAGDEGENILKNVLKMKGVPKILPNKLTATVRGEIVLFAEDFDKHFKEEYSNPRNCASGTSRRSDGTGCEYLTVMTYQLTTDEIEFETEVEQFETLKGLGFLVPEYHLFHSAKEVVEFKEEFQANKRDKYKVGLDGLVIRNNNLEQQYSYGIKHDRPVGARAYKFTNEEAETILKDVIWQTGSSGRITPVAILEPVEIGGAEIKRASIYNYSYIKELSLDIGARVVVERGGDIIPLISSVVVSTGTIAKCPDKCPTCFGSVAVIGENLFCISGETCKNQIIGRLDNWLSNLNVLEWGNALLDRLVESGKVKTIIDLYKLSENDLSNLDRMGQRSAQNCLKTLHAKKTIPLDVFLGSLTIPLIGRSMIRLVMAAGYDNLDKILSAKESDFESIKGFSSTKAAAIFNGLIKNKQLISELREIIMIEQKAEEKVAIKDGKLSGKSIVITGKTDIKRAILQEMIEAAGGSLMDKVRPGVDYLVIVDINSQTSKAVAARKLGTVLISEDNLLQMME